MQEVVIFTKTFLRLQGDRHFKAMMPTYLMDRGALYDRLVYEAKKTCYDESGGWNPDACNSVAGSLRTLFLNEATYAETQAQQ